MPQMLIDSLANCRSASRQSNLIKTYARSSASKDLQGCAAFLTVLMPVSAEE